MKKIFQLIISIIVVFVISSCTKNMYQVFRLEEQSEFSHKDGMFYFLPRTVINVEVTVEKTDKVKGPYSAYSSKYLGISNPIHENSTSYRIADIQIKTLNEPDPEKIFFLVFPKSNNKKNQLMITLKENGIIESVNVHEDSISSQMQQFKSASLNNDFSNQIEPFKMFINDNIMEKVDTLFEFIHLDTMTIEKQIYQKSTIEKSMEQKAREASEYIIMLNELKVNLISGYQEVDYDETTLRQMIGEIDKLIGEYMSLFIGKTITQTMTYNFTYTPESSTKNNSIFLFSIDKNSGLSDTESTDLSQNIYIELMPSLTTSKIEPIVSSQSSDTKHRKGFYYNIPEKTKIILTKDKSNVLFESNIMINQFGVVHFLPAKHYKILYFDNSASLRRIQ
jgi:hypothetical protein